MKNLIFLALVIVLAVVAVDVVRACVRKKTRRGSGKDDRE
jgi:hypothetical protein